MPEITADLFCEDQGHESFVRALVQRLAGEGGVPVRLRSRNARGGLGRAMSELKRWQRCVARLQAPRADLLIVVIDANAVGAAKREREVREALRDDLFLATAIGCPDPYVERWYFADPQAWRAGTGASLPPIQRGERGAWKRAMNESLREAGQVVLNDYSEFAIDVIECMDLYLAAKAQPSFRRFVEQVRHGIQTCANALD